MAERTLELYIGVNENGVGLFGDRPIFSSFIDGEIAKTGKLIVGNPNDYWHEIAEDVAKLIKKNNLSGYKIFNNGTIPRHAPNKPSLVQKVSNSRVLILSKIIDSELERTL